MSEPLALTLVTPTPESITVVGGQTAAATITVGAPGPAGAAGAEGKAGAAGAAGPPGPAELVAKLIAELEAHGFAKWQATAIYAALAKEGKTLTLSSYIGNTTSKLTFTDLLATFTGPVTVLGKFTASSSEASSFIGPLSVALLVISPLVNAPVQSEIVSWASAALQGTIRVTGFIGEPGQGTDIGGMGSLGEAAKEGQRIRIVNNNAEVMRFWHQALVLPGGLPAFSPKGPWSSETTYALHDTVEYEGRIYVSKKAGNLGNDPEGLGEWWKEKQAVSAVNRIICRPAEAANGNVEIKKGSVLEGEYNAVAKRWEVWKAA